MVRTCSIEGCSYSEAVTLFKDPAVVLAQAPEPTTYLSPVAVNKLCRCDPGCSFYVPARSPWDLHPCRHARAVCWVSSHTIQQIFLTVHCKSLLCLRVMKSQHSLEQFYHTILCKATDAIKSRLPCNEVHSCHNAKALNKWPMLQEHIVISCSVTAMWCTTVEVPLTHGHVTASILMQ